MKNTMWEYPTSYLSLQQNEVHVWRWWLQWPDDVVYRLHPLLSFDEWQRAKRFHFEMDRKRYIVRRGILRTILGRYVNKAPRDVLFAYGINDKPYVSKKINQQPVNFNLSHAYDLCLCAFTRGHEIGVDVEQLRVLDDMEDIAKKYLSQEEKRVFASLPKAQMVEGFFNCWTRKEAFIKGTGDGLMRPLDSFEVSLRPGDPAKIFHINGNQDDPLSWSIRSVTPASGYVGAVAVEKPRDQCKFLYYEATFDEP